jgi:hypothetical protein
MTDLQRQIELLEAGANEAELLGALARDAETRRRNRLLADQLREEAQALRRQVRAIAA